MLRYQRISLFGWLPDEAVFTAFIQREHSFGNPGELPGYVAQSHCLVCPSCNVIWARLSLDPEVLCWPRAQFCQDCNIWPSEWCPVPGSLLIEEAFGLIDTELLRALPLELLKREFDTHVAVYNKLDCVPGIRRP